MANDQAIKWAKAKVCVYADSVPCVGRQDPGPAAIEDGESQVLNLKGYTSYQDALGIDGKTIEFEWKIFQGFTTLNILQQSQRDMQDKNIPPEKFEDLIIIMSMFNDITWKKDDQNFISNEEKVKDYAKKHKPGHWTFLGPGSETRWYGDSLDGQWDRTANKMVQQVKETSYPIFTSTSALSRGVLKGRNGSSTIHLNGDSINAELLFQKNHSVNHINIYAAITDWCYQLGLTNEEKERVATPVDNGPLTMMDPEEVEMMVSPALGNKMHGDMRFRTLDKMVHMTQLCAKALFQHLVPAGNFCIIKPDGDDGWEDFIPLCREIFEHSSSSESPGIVRNSRRYNYWTSH